MPSATRIRGLSVRDIRFPTALELDGSDAIHPDPDYSSAYVILFTDSDVRGYGYTFTIGRGNDLAVEAIKTLAHLIVGKTIKQLFDNFAETWRTLTSDSQLRWMGPEKGVVHMAVSAIVNALFDLWARISRKPVWKLLVDMEPEELVGTIDFRYIDDVLTREEAIEILRSMQEGKEEREQTMKHIGYPAYVTAAGWLGYTDHKVEEKCCKLISEGWKHFKIKVGQNLEDDKRRCAIVRKCIGTKNTLMLDANQKWGVDEAINWMTELKEFQPLFIEEPTSPDDILGHLAIKKALQPLGIKVATGEMCQNRIMFKQFLQTGAIDFCQIDACRLGGVPEVLAVYLMAKKYNVPVCPHAGGVGLCEMVQHLQIWDYISVSGTSKDRLIEYADNLNQHFKNPINMHKCHYLAPHCPGYSTAMWGKSLADYEYPIGPVWKKLFADGLYSDPSKERPPYVESLSREDDTIKLR